MTYYSKENRDRQNVRVGIVCFDGVATLDLSGPLEAFARADSAAVDGETHRYETLLISVKAKGIVSDAGAVFRAAKTLATAPQLDTVIIPGGKGIRTAETSAAIGAWLKERASSIRRIVCISTGIYAVAPTGLLDGHRVTTHWRFAQALAREFPGLQVIEAAPIVRDRGVYTCGGGTASIEMTLALIEEDFGSQVALAAARELVMELKPPVETESLLTTIDYQVSPREKLADMPVWIATHLRENLSVEALAERAMMCPRHFSRLFKSMFHVTPADFVEQLRLDEARRRLRSPRQSVESIAAAVGFNSDDAFRRAFERRFSITPRAFRNSERRSRKDGQAATASD